MDLATERKNALIRGEQTTLCTNQEDPGPALLASFTASSSPQHLRLYICEMYHTLSHGSPDTWRWWNERRGEASSSPRCLKWVVCNNFLATTTVMSNISKPSLSYLMCLTSMSLSYPEQDHFTARHVGLPVICELKT